MLESQGMSIYSFEPEQHGDQHSAHQESIHSSLANLPDKVDWCIFSIEIRNSYGLPFEVAFECEQAGENSLPRVAGLSNLTCGILESQKTSTTVTVSPGTTSRYVVSNLCSLIERQS